MEPAVGTSSRSSSTRFAATAVCSIPMPVAFFPGWLRDATRPIATGSLPMLKTIGIVCVAALAASAEEEPLGIAITETRRRTRSPINSGSRS